MISGPHTNAAVLAGSVTAPSMNLVTRPTSPFQSASARSTVTRTLTPRLRQRLKLAGEEQVVR